SVFQEISASNGRLLSHDVGVESFTEYIDDAIDDYISSNNAESCCKKLENALLNGFQYERLIISDITRKVWKFLVHGNGYLEEVKDPVEFRWWETIKFVGNNGFNLEGIMEGQERDELFGLSGHCLLYGGILSNISGGHDSHLSRYVRRLVYDGDGK
ncbi:hypothetical protein Ccrd_014426, partial [Cynara cardunculus var. scolymus]